MTPILMLCLTLRVTAGVWAVLLWRRVRDWRLAFLTGLVALLALDTALRVNAAAAAPGPVDLGVSLLALLGVVFVGRALARERSAWQDLERERAHFEQLFESAPEAIVLVDNDSRVLRVNSEFTRMFGYAPREALNRSIDELLAPGERFDEALAITRRVAQGAHVSLETVRRRKDGTLLDVSILGTPIRVAGGQVAVYGIYRDVSSWKRTLEALRASEEKFSRAFRSNPGAATITTLEEGRLLDVNDAFVRITGYPSQDAIGRTVKELGLWRNDDDRRRMMRVLGTRGAIRDMEFEFVVKGGGVRTGLFSADLIELDGQRRLLSMTSDITERKQFEEALRQSELRYRTIVETIEDGYYEVDLAGSLTFFNSALERMLGYPAEQLAGMSNRQYMDPVNAERVYRTFNEVFRTRASTRAFDWEIIRRDGTRRTVEASVTPMLDAAGRATGFRGIVRDVTERKLTERALRDSEQRYALAARGANDGLWDWDLARDTIYYSPRWKSMLGHQEHEIGPAPDEWFRRVHERDRGRLQAELKAHLEGPAPYLQNEHRILHHDGTYRWVLCRGVAERDPAGRPVRIAGSLTDISARKNAEERLIHDAFHDVLTGLPNRALFTNLLERSLGRILRRADQQFAVLFLDLDRFKVINDSLGHMVGDQLLVAIAQRLQTCLRPGDTVARLGGDEFTILLDDINGVDDVHRVAGRIQSELAAPFPLGSHEVYATVSIGIALGAPHYRRPEEVLRDADTAMYRAKSEGRARHEIFDTGMHESAVSLLKLETDLRRALDRAELRIFYQPIITPRTGHLAGFEALLRWAHPERGLVPPADFIQLAEETGLIIPIGQWVLWEACRQACAWRGLLNGRPGAVPLTVSVNLSPRQFTQEDLVGSVTDALEVTGLAPEALKLEITESVLMDRAEASIRRLEELKTLGVQVQVDDFGTGYSSLSYLHRFRLDALKIDRSFVEMVGREEAESAEIVRTIVMLARNLGMAVVAEGVETEAQRRYLEALECEQMQGFLFCGPVAAAEAEGLIRSGRRW